MLWPAVLLQVLHFRDAAQASRLNIHVYRLYEEAPAEEYDEEVGQRLGVCAASEACAVPLSPSRAL